MPEVLTLHPEIVKKVLASAGIKCGTGMAKRILKDCPNSSFCSLPGGELCIYGLNNQKKMTQFKCSQCGKIGHRKNNRKFHGYKN